MSLLCSVQTAADGQLPGYAVLLAVLAAVITVIALSIPALIRANRTVNRMPLPERPDVIGGNKP